MKVHLRNVQFEVAESPNKPFWDYVNSGRWEPETFELIDNFVGSGSHVLDMGCWIGPLSLYMAAKGAQVWSIDPDPVAYPEFIQNLELNPNLQDRIHPFQIAITPSDQQIVLHARESYGSSSSSILARTRDSENSERVAGLTLSTFLKQQQIKKVDFIKIDIEGGEFEILPALEDTLAQLGWPTLFVSFHYAQLNEFVYRKKIKWRFLSLALMKVESWLGFRLFRKDLESILESAIQFAGNYPFVYEEEGTPVKQSTFTPNYMLKHEPNLLFTHKKWE